MSAEREEKTGPISLVLERERSRNGYFSRELPLDVKCPACRGEGVRETGKPIPDDIEPCATCDGVCYNLTEAGKTLKAFILRHVMPDEMGV